jgi:TonB family protein
MLKYHSILGVVTILSAAPVFSLAAETAAAVGGNAAIAPICQVAQLAAVRTAFPQASQSRGEHGDVVVKVTISKEGRASHTQIAQSSGYPSLDKAAADSISKHWRFDVTGCSPAQLPATSSVTVQFQRAPQYTLSGTVNSRRPTVAATNDQMPKRCDTTLNPSGDQVVACVSIAPLASSTPQQSLANRREAAERK